MRGKTAVNNKPIYNDDRRVLSGLEKSFLHQVLSHERILLAMRSTCRCAVCLTCLRLLASPNSAGGGLGRARVVSWREACCFLFFCKIIVPISILYSYVKYLSVWVWTYNKLGRSARSSLSLLCISGQRFKYRKALAVFFRCVIFGHIFLAPCIYICIYMVCGVRTEYVADLLFCLQ